MSYSISILTKAKLEIKKARRWYEDKSIGLGDRFVTEINYSIDSLIRVNVDHKPVFKDKRRLLVPNFPYVIYYIRDEANMKVIILGVLHNKQSARDIEKRFS